MELFTLVFVLAMAASSFAWHVDGSCSKDVSGKAGTGEKRVANVKAGMEEAVLVLKNAAEIAGMYASSDVSNDSDSDCQQLEDELEQ